MDKYLIINADDFGMCRAANLAVISLFKCGGITSSTIMMPCGWAPEACNFAGTNPDFAIGVHLTTTSEWSKYRWSPVSTNNTDSLRDKYGFMYDDCPEFEEKANLDEVANEIRAQINRAKNLGLNPSHIDNHMGSLYGITTGRIELLSLTFDIAAEYGLPFRFPSKYYEGQFDNETLGIEIDKNSIIFLFEKISAYAKDKGVVTPDYLLPHEWNGPQKDSYDNFREYIYELVKTYPEGVTETYIHPSFECDELKGTTSLWERRVWEYNLFADPATRKHFEACGIKLINYRDLQKMYGG